MTEQEYNQAEGVRRSDLWVMHESAEKYRYNVDHPQEATPALVFGSACHKMILEPETFVNEYAIAPVCDRRTKDGKAMYEAFMEQNLGKTIISANDAQVMTEMEEALNRCSLAHSLIHEDGQNEVPIFWVDGETGERCKVKLDRLINCLDGRVAVVDYKTAKNANTDQFNRAIFNNGYHLQAAMYTEAVMNCLKLDYRPVFIFVVQEKKAPYSVNVVQVSPEVMEYGDKVFHSLLGRLHTCKELDDWPGYLPVDGKMNWTDLPAWENFDEEDEDE